MCQRLFVRLVFAVETLDKNNDSVTVTQRMYREHFNIGRHGTVPDHNRSFKTLLVQQMTDPERQNTERPLENTERLRCRYRSQPPNDLDPNMSNRSLRLILHSVLQFSHPQKSHRVRTVIQWFSSKKCILWAICYLSERTSTYYSSLDNVRWSWLWTVWLCEYTKLAVLERS